LLKYRKAIASIDYSGIIQLWKPNNESVIIGQHTDPGGGIVPICRDKWLVTGDMEGAIKVWDVATKSVYWSIQLPVNPDTERAGLHSIHSFSDNDTRFAILDYYGEFSIWDCARKTRIRKCVIEVPPPLDSIVIDPDHSRAIATISYKTGPAGY